MARGLSVRFELLVLDLDGTLVDSATDLARAVNGVLQGYGRPPLDLPRIKGMIGDGAARLIARALAASGIAVSQEPAALRRFHQLYQADLTAHTMPYPGVRETLDLLSERGALMAVCTNKPAAAAVAILQHLDLARHFGQVIGGDTWPFRKPDPRMLGDLIRTYGKPPAQTLMIGDSEVDAATAAAAQVAFALVSYGYRRGPAANIEKRVQLERFDELPAFLGA